MTRKCEGIGNHLIIIYSVLLLIVISESAIAQERHGVLKLSGYVVSGDSLQGQPGVVVYVPGTKRGALTQVDGHFSFGVIAGDSVVISALGFESQYLKVPEESKHANFVVNIKLKASVTMLPTVKVMPWATERDLKLALLKLDLPEEPQVNMNFVYVKPDKKSILNAPPLDAAGNFRLFNQQQTQQRESRYRMPDVIRLTSIPIN